MNKKIFIYHHLGLGDHFHCNGVVRFLLENKFINKKVYLFAKKIFRNDKTHVSRYFQTRSDIYN